MTKEQLIYLSKISEILEYEPSTPNPEPPGSWKWELWQKEQEEWRKAWNEAAERDFHHTYNPELFD
jgi:hypothetical protein